MSFRNRDILLRPTVEDNLSFIFDLIDPFPEDFFDYLKDDQLQTGKKP